MKSIWMKFVVDENLLPRLAAWLGERRHDAVHCYDAETSYASDLALAVFAQVEGRAIATKDTDFDPPKQKERVLRLAVGNCTNADLITWLDRHLDVAINRFERGEVYVERT